MMRMSEQLAGIARRKAVLLQRSAAQREAMASALNRWRGPVAMADRGLEAVRFLGAHPLLVAAAVAGLVTFRRGGVLVTAGRLLAAWRVWRVVSTLSARRLS